MFETRTHAPFALALLAATCLTPVASAQAAPGDRLGPEFQVNSFTSDYQHLPAVAMDADGDFVVAWQGYGQDGNYWGVFAQRFDAAGVPRGPEFQVNTYTTNNQGAPAVAMDADGDFIVVWESYFQDSSGDGVFAQRYDAAGVAQGPEIQVNTFTAQSQYRPSVAMAADGDFVVAWGGGQDGSYGGVSAQRFDAAGVAQGPEFQVNTSTVGDQGLPAVAMDADGDFVVAWTDTGDQDGNGWGVFAQRFDAAGTAQGPEFQVNTFTALDQLLPAVAMDAEGDFVVAWESQAQDGSLWSVFAQRFDAAGAAQGPEFPVNTVTTSLQERPVMAMDADGDFVVAWQSQLQDGSGSGVFARRYDATGAAQGSEFQVNTFTTDDQKRPAVAMDADGDVVVAWHSYAQDGDGFGVFAQRFDGVERIEGDFNGDGKADLLWRNVATGATVVWLMNGETKLAEGPLGTLPDPWQVAGTGDFNGDGKADILWRNTATGNAVVWQMNGLEKAASQSIGMPPLAWVVEQLRDTNGDGLSDIVWRHTGTGNTVIWRMSGFTRVAAEPIGSVNSDWLLR